MSARTGLLLWQFTWGDQGLVSITDVDGDVTTVDRALDGTARALVAQDGQRTELTVNAGRVERITDPLGRFVEAAYFSSGLLSEWKGANGNSTAFTWDDVGNLETHQNARGAKKEFQPLPAGGGVEFTSPEGRKTQYRKAIAGGGVVLSTEWPDGTQSSRAYGSGIEHHFGSDGTYVEIEMQGGPTSRFGRLVDVPGRVKVRTPAGLEFSATSERISTNAPNDFLSVTAETEETRVNGRPWQSRYDGLARTYQVTSPEGRIASGTLDAKLRPTTITEPGMLPVTHSYDARGRVESATQGTRSATFTYDSNGFLDSVRNALNEVTRYSHDKSGRLQKEILADAREVTVEYDLAGNLTAVTPPDAGTHRFVYDGANQVTAYVPPPVTGVADQTTTWDLDGLMTRSSHFDSTQTVLTREPSGRITQIATPWWVSDFTHVPATGQLRTLTRGAQRLEWQYDGFLLKEERAIGVAQATSQWTFDTDFRPVTHTINGASITYTYDGDSLLTQAGAATLTRLPATGQLSTLTVGGVITTVTHNPYGELGTLAVTANAAAIYSEGLTWDAAGRLSVVEEIIEGVPVQWVYGYDPTGQLISAAKNGAAATRWTYDGNGNRLTQDGVASIFDAQDRLETKGSTIFEWDALGGRLTKTDGAAVTRYAHDGLGALTSVTLPDSTVVTYEYDGRQRRIAKSRGGAVVKRWIYDGQYRVAAEVDATGAVTSRFVYGSQSHSPDYLVRAGVTYAYVKNHIGSIKLVVNASSGAIAQRIDYDTWGNITVDSSPDFQPFAFAGGIHDVDSGLTHFGFRDYDPVSGTWTSRDPVGLKAGLNAFAYSVNPVTQIDPSGLTIWRQAFLVAQAGIRTGKKLSEKAAKAFLRKGGNVVTNERKAQERVARQLSQQAGGGGGCTPPESHGRGAPHIHPTIGGDNSNRVEGLGHIFLDTDLMLIPGIMFDADGDGVWFEGDDALEWVNPSPYSIEQWNDLDPFGVRRGQDA